MGTAIAYERTGSGTRQVRAGIARVTSLDTPSTNASGKSGSRMVISDGSPAADTEMAERRVALKLSAEAIGPAIPDVVFSDLGKWRTASRGGLTATLLSVEGRHARHTDSHGRAVARAPRRWSQARSPRPATAGSPRRVAGPDRRL